MSVAVDVVVPTSRPDRLALLLGRLEQFPGRVIVVEGRRGPAAARNEGWRASRADWVAFLDDDVLPEAGWAEALERDLAGLDGGVAGSQGRVRVPAPPGRRPTDWERNVAGLETAHWATADMAYRRAALEQLGGFDERFPRAYREDADLALRVVAAGWRLVRGARTVAHPVRPAGPWISVRLQAGNADDALMRAVHGPAWRSRAAVPRGRRPRHVVVTAAALVALAFALARRRGAAAACAAVWLAGSAELAWARIAPGPRSREEIVAMALTSAVLPAAATFHWLRGWLALPRTLRRRPPPRAVLLDRDGTLVVDVPYNGDPARVVPMPGVREALDRLRAAGVALAVVSNQSGVGRGLLTSAEVAAVNRRVEELLGPLGPWFVCPHAPDAGCGCRKPAPGMVVDAARALGLRPDECALIGDTGADVAAAVAAGARPVLVPNAVTRREEIARAPEVAPDLATAVDRLLGTAR
jgi:histidinol-phosphate phosphatase family protein